MLLQVLGTAAGSGIPSGTARAPDAPGHAQFHWRRRHASLAVRTGEGRWYLVNATPDLGDQIEAYPALHPGPGRRQTPVAGLVLTDAELDHTTGLTRLREAHDGLEVFATAPVRQAIRDRLRLDTVLAPYTDVAWHDLPVRGSAPLGAADGGEGLRGSALPVSGKRPRYAAEEPDDEEWAVALRLYDPATGASVLYAPALAAWPDHLHRAAAEADCVIVDGTFWDEEEPRRAGVCDHTATGMGHLPVAGPGGTAALLAPLTARCLYTHLNNTNPLVDPDAPQHKQLARLGLEVAHDGMVIQL
ncbi:MBL fold metallo-hydrolase [Streptomyces sp. GD-15H]|uniref:pyrroloquinoline quinone biosynthesis protein PqqB n=1 Tax=Streptomyces sp. GD-15H TaxID=3129112 RepID=UPI003245F638